MARSLNNHVFKGHKALLGGRFVTYRELELSARYDIYSKSANGFDWGNHSDGSLQLSFAILYQLTDKELATKYAQQYTTDVISKITSRDWILSSNEILDWVDTHCEKSKQEEEQQVQPVTRKKTQPVRKPKRDKKPKSNVVKDVCQELNITQKILAEILEVPEGTVSSWAVKNEIPRLGKKAIEFYILYSKNQKIVDSYKSFKELLEVSK